MDLSELRFDEGHTWIRDEGKELIIGITEYAQEQLGDVIFVELPEPGAKIVRDRDMLAGAVNFLLKNPAARQKMIDAGVAAPAIEVFSRFYELLESGATGVIREDTIEPLLDPPMLADVDITEAEAREAIGKTVIIKLNGGLGTSMGLDAAKSLLPVRNGKNFLDITVDQVRHARRARSYTLRQRIGVHQPPLPARLRDPQDHVHPRAGGEEERRLLCGAEELGPRAGVGRLLPLRHRGRARPPQPDLGLGRRVRELLPAQPEAGVQAPRRRQGRQEVPPGRHPTPACPRAPRDPETAGHHDERPIQEASPRCPATRDPPPHRPPRSPRPGQGPRRPATPDRDRLTGGNR